MRRSRKPLVANHRMAVAGGLVAAGVAVVLLWDAYEGRGNVRPLALRFIPGP